MATLEAAAHPTDRHSRRKPFANWMKRLANLKSTSSSSTVKSGAKRNYDSPTSKKKKASIKNNPYPQSGKPVLDLPLPANPNGHLSFHTPPSGHSVSYASPNHSKASIPASSDGLPPPTIGNKSVAPTVSTNPETLNSDTVHSKAGTAATIGGGVSSSGVGGGDGSTFSSPAPSVRSMTTTLTTMQSAAPSMLLTAPNAQGQQNQAGIAPAGHVHQPSNASHFQHQFPTTPVSAIPPHLNQHAHQHNPNTYNAATANNLLSDNASVLTLASSSKRRRRNSLDTNASIRALAPSSVYGGSKESLPLSVLSASVNDQASGTGHHQSRQPNISAATAERASVYSSSGIAPALSSERNSYYASKQPAQGDGSSVRSGLIGHGRNDSIARSISGIAATESPLSSPREISLPEKLSRQNSEKTETVHTDDDEQSIKRRMVSVST